MAMTLKAARVNAGFVQAEAARRLNISKSTLVNYEKYKTIPDMEMGKRIAELYGVSVDNIIFFKH